MDSSGKLGVSRLKPSVYISPAKSEKKEVDL